MNEPPPYSPVASTPTACFLCLGLGGIARHEKWSAERGKPLWTAHTYPSTDAHDTLPCPVCNALPDAPLSADSAHEPSK